MSGPTSSNWCCCRSTAASRIRVAWAPRRLANGRSGWAPIRSSKPQIDSVRVIDPDREPIFLGNRPAIAVPSLAPAQSALAKAGQRPPDPPSRRARRRPRRIELSTKLNRPAYRLLTRFAVFSGQSSRKYAKSIEQGNGSHEVSGDRPCAVAGGEAEFSARPRENLWPLHARRPHRTSLPGDRHVARQCRLPRRPRRRAGRKGHCLHRSHRPRRRRRHAYARRWLRHDGHRFRAQEGQACGAAHLARQQARARSAGGPPSRARRAAQSDERA